MNAFEAPAASDLLFASVLVGLLFLLRFWLAMRRIFTESEKPGAGGIEPYRDATRPMSFGRALEPNRRHAARQLYVALLCLSLAVVLAAWLAATRVLG